MEKLFLNLLVACSIFTFAGCHTSHKCNNCEINQKNCECKDGICKCEKECKELCKELCKPN